VHRDDATALFNDLSERLSNAESVLRSPRGRHSGETYAVEIRCDSLTLSDVGSLVDLLRTPSDRAKQVVGVRTLAGYEGQVEVRQDEGEQTPKPTLWIVVSTTVIGD
jgi:hypothetical protein